MSPARTLAALCLLLAGLALPVAPAQATPQDENPLAGRVWGVYKGGAEMAWAPYVQATGRKKELLGKIALRPKAKWFGAWIPDGEIAGKVKDYIANATGGDDDVLVQLTLFRMVPWEQHTCERLPTQPEKDSYRRYVRRFAHAIGDARAAVIVQPDGPFAECGRIYSRLIRYAVERLDAQPRTTTYIEVGSSAWNQHDPERAARLLALGGVDRARGFHLNTTHYQATADEVRFGSRVVQALADRGIHGKHFTVDTAENGRPFTWEWFWAHHPDGVWNNAPTCRRRSQTHCVTLGIPPTTRVAAKKWDLPADVRRLARQHVDAYLWAGRPWLHVQSAPFDMERALSMARTTPY